MREHRAAAARGAPRVAVTANAEGLEGARVELVDLTSEHDRGRVALGFGDTDAGVSLTDDLDVVWALIVEADRQLARLADHRRAR